MKDMLAIGMLVSGGVLLLGASVNVPNPDEALVREAVLDYVEACYNVQPERIEKSVDPNMVKLGFFRGKNYKDYRPGEAMTYKELLETAAKYNKSGKLPKDAPKEIVVFEVLDKTACAKLKAQWGIDYFHLAKVDGKWKIYQVMWQSNPA
jgi:hypothetical protein